MEVFHDTATECHLPYLSLVTCYPTQVNTSRLKPAIQAGTRFNYTPEEWKDELT